MAFIGKLRKHAGVAVGFVAVSMGAFVLGGDLLSGNSQLFADDTSVGEIAGVKVPYENFAQKMKEQENNFRINKGASPTEQEQSQILEQVWNQYIYDIAFNEQVEELGVDVHEEELFDMVQGENIHPQVSQSFQDENGKFDKNRLIQYLQLIGSEYDAERFPMSQADFINMKNQWLRFEEGLPLTRKIEKYNNLLSKSTYITTLEATNKYNADNESVNAKFLYVPYVSIIDSTVEISDSDLKAYLNENAEKFKKEEATRSLEYVVFPVVPSGEDSLIAMDELVNLKEDFITSEDDSLFSKAKADNFVEPVFSSLGTVAPVIQEAYPNIEVGSVFGPVLEGSAYKMYKISDVTEDSVYAARASHILFKAASQSDEDLAIALADCKKVLREIKDGADFAEMASIHGTDGTKDRGGDLGWFKEGAMVPEFNDAVMAASSEGILSNPVKTNFGYHIIKITGVKTNVNYKISVVDREIIAGEETRDIAYRKADIFAGDNTTEEAFNMAIEEDSSLTKNVSENIKANDRFLRGAGNARRTIQWAFNEETEVGDISEVVDLEDGYVVALLTKVSEKGVPSLDDVREEITVKVRNQKKAEQIKSTLGTGSLDDMKSTYGADASIMDANSVTLNTTSIPGIGYDPEMTGYFHSVESGSTSEPIAGETGVVVIQSVAKTPAQAKEDFTSEKSTLLNQYSGRVTGFSFEAIKDAADIEDNRVKYY